MTDLAGSAQAAEFQAIIEAYAAYVDELKLSPLEIRDESELPYPKKKITDALTAAYSLSGELSYAPVKIRGWLLLLAQFQSGVGEPIRDPAAEVARRMTNARDRGEGTDPSELARQVAEESEDAGWWIRRTEFAGKVDQDRARLLGLL